MKIFLIRHGITEGNKQHRYVGITDEGLSGEGVRCLKAKREHWKKEVSGKLCQEDFLKAETLYVSPLVRCRQSGEILYPDKRQNLVPELRECDFGEFEYKNYEELKGREDYQRFLDSNGKSGFPGGETLSGFQNRCAEAFKVIVKKELKKKTPGIAFVVHGGTIMAILDRFSHPHRDYFKWQVKNGEGFSASVFEREEEFYLGDIKKLWE